MLRRLYLCLLALITAPLAISAQKKAADILVISSEVEHSNWAQNMLRPIRNLETDRPDLSISWSYLSMLSHAGAESLHETVRGILDRHALQPRLVIINGGSCFSLVKNVRNRWPEVPMILLGQQDYYCDLDYVLDIQAHPGQSDDAYHPLSYLRDEGYNLTLISARIMYRRTVDMILQLQPDIHKLFILAGENFLSRETLWRTEQFLHSNYPSLPYQVVHSGSFSTDRMISLLEKEGGSGTAVLFLSWLVRDDYRESVVTRYGTVSMIEHLAPVYTIYPVDLKEHPNVIGYYSYPAGEYDRTVRQRVLDVLDHGVQPLRMPFAYLQAGVPSVNYPAMEHFGLDTGLIPEDAVIFNEPRSLWEKYKTQIMWAALGLLLAVAGIVLYILHKSMDAMRMARKMAENANRMKTAFIQNMSHEVRTPLNAITGFAQLLCTPDGYLTEEEKVEYLGNIKNNSRLLAMMMSDMQGIAEMESGQYRIKNTAVDLDEIARQAIKSVEYLLPPGVVFVRSFGLNDDARYVTDAMRVQQILINFLTNACKYTEQGSITVGSSLEENPGQITLYVADTGSGVPPEKAESIFERFVKLDEFKQGAGLGLPICRMMAERLGGRVWLDTEYTGGARFVLTIPKVEAK